MRTLKQPGPVSQPRLIALPAQAARELRVVLPAGRDLHEGVVSVLRGAGIADAAIRITGGSFSSMQYLTGQPDASGARVATYGAPTPLEGPVLLIGASAILGRLENGDPILHCHAVVADRDGRIHGGHLPPGVCIAGPEGLTAWVTVLAGGGFAVRYDAETNYQIFQPAGAA
jgi:predicted DNA-binding protein with PD1-like motif